MTADLKSTYLGLSLRNPLVASASPMTGKLESLQRLEAAGVGAVVLPSLFEEQIEHDERQLDALLEFGAESQGEALDYFPPLEGHRTGAQRYRELVGMAKDGLSIPVIASLNGTTTGGWVRHAKALQDCGADALELNIYLVAADARATGAEMEQRYLELVSAVKQNLEIPLAVKVGPYFSSIGNMLVRLQDAGANGLVLFNRFLQPDIDLDTLAVEPRVELSTSLESRLPLRWIALMRDELRASLAATSGVQDARDVLKLLLVGADAVMMTSALLRHGPDHVATVLGEVAAWLREEGYDSVEQMKGSMSREKSGSPGAYERANYIKTLVSYTGPWV